MALKLEDLKDDEYYTPEQTAEVLGMTKDEVIKEILADRLFGKRGRKGGWIIRGAKIKEYAEKYGKKE